MTTRRKGVRHYFSKPLKGHKRYGALKRWRGPVEQIIPEEDSKPSAIRSESSIANNVFVEVLKPSLDMFRGFDVSPYNWMGPSGRAKKPIRVLSLFDGIATGFYILRERLRLNVEVYYSSEVDLDALKVQRENFNDHITPVGSVLDLTEDKLKELGRIDLLIGGSPCSDLSFVNPKRRGLHEPASSGCCFVEFARILEYCKRDAEVNHQKFYWLFENTCRMEKKNCDVISRTLGCWPVTLNAASYVPMERARNFWGNLNDTVQPPRGGDVAPLDDFLQPGRKAQVRRVQTLTTNVNAQCTGKGALLPVVEDEMPALLLITEQERLFGFPDHYTDCGNMSVTRRRRLLGKAWSVDVVESILRPLTDWFSTTCRSL